MFLALGINTEGQKELPGMWLAGNEGAKFWLTVLTELKSRGLQDILIACVDGLKGFPDATNSVYPQISKSWRAHWENLNTFFNYPPGIHQSLIQLPFWVLVKATYPDIANTLTFHTPLILIVSEKNL